MGEKDTSGVVSLKDAWERREKEAGGIALKILDRVQSQRWKAAGNPEFPKIHSDVIGKSMRSLVNELLKVEVNTLTQETCLYPYCLAMSYTEQNIGKLWQKSS